MRPRSRMVLAGVALALFACNPSEDKPPVPPKSSGSASGTSVGSSGTSDTGETDTDGGTDESETDTGGMLPPTDFNYAFVTSEAYVPGELGGPLGADEKCQALADAASLGGNYVAWLSTSTTDAKSRIAGARQWLRTDLRPFADSVDDIINGRLLYPLRLDESGNDLPDVRVVTATRPDGTKLNDNNNGTCLDWTSSDPQIFTSGGYSDAGDELWTSGFDLDCAEARHLYCLGIDNDEPLQFDGEEGRAAFLSTDPFVANLGIDAADALCQQEATQAGLAGQFAALLATDALAASERFDLDGLPWVRTDGVAIVESAADLETGLLAPITMDAEQFPLGVSWVWTGAMDVSSASMTLSCASWTSAVGEGRTGLSGRSNDAWFSNSMRPCADDMAYLYCLEQ